MSSSQGRVPVITALTLRLWWCQNVCAAPYIASLRADLAVNADLGLITFWRLFPRICGLISESDRLATLSLPPLSPSLPVLPDLAHLREYGASGPPSRVFSKCLRAWREKPKIWRIKGTVKFYCINFLTFSIHIFENWIFVPFPKRPKLQKIVTFLRPAHFFWRISTISICAFLTRNHLWQLCAPSPPVWPDSRKICEMCGF